MRSNRQDTERGGLTMDDLLFYDFMKSLEKPADPEPGVSGRQMLLACLAYFGVIALLCLIIYDTL